MNPMIIPDWRERVVFSSEGPQPQVLIATDKLKSVLVGLEVGVQIPVHPGPAAVYHFLEGEGQMIVDEEHIPVQAGMTIVVPDGARRGMETETRLSFLGTHSGEH